MSAFTTWNEVEVSVRPANSADMVSEDVVAVVALSAEHAGVVAYLTHANVHDLIISLEALEGM